MAVISDLRELTAEIKQWCDEVYPTRTRDHMIAKLREEFQEFLDEPLNAWEMADIMIIMLDLADCLGFDLPKIISHKMDINRNQRTWTVKDGILKHDQVTRHPESGDREKVPHSEHDASAESR